MQYLKNAVSTVIVALGSLVSTAHAAPPAEASVTQLMTQPLADYPGKEALMITVEYPPGASDPVHRHHAHGFIYVLEGAIVMQVKGGKQVTLTPGQTFYEGPNDVHTVGRNEWFDSRFLQRDMFDWALNIALVKSGDRLILIDSGVGDGFEYFTRAGRSVMRLETAGIDLAAITDIVVTHMHMDHVGGLNVDGVKARLRPDVRIHVAAAEVEFWKNPDFSKTVMPEAVPPALRKAAATFVELYGRQIVQFDQTVEVATGVSARVTGGHTPGHCVVDVVSNGERLTFVGDAIFEVGFDNPKWQNGFEHEPEVAADVRIALLNEAAETGALLAAAHVAFPSIGHVAKNGESFRFVPVQ